MRMAAVGNQLQFAIDGVPILTTSDNRFLNGGTVTLVAQSVQVEVRRISILDCERDSAACISTLTQ
jgi:hypothetical protein